MDIIEEANELLGRVTYTEDNSAENEHCKVEVSSRPADEAERQRELRSEDPLYEVIVKIIPRASGKEHDLANLARKRGVRFTHTDSERRFEVLWPTRDGRGLVHHFNRRKSDLENGFKLQLK